MNPQQYDTLLAQMSATITAGYLKSMGNDAAVKHALYDARAILKEIGIEPEV